MTHTPVLGADGRKHISAYRLQKDMCVEGVLKAMNSSSSEEAEWLRQVTECAGRLQRCQTLMDKYMKPKSPPSTSTSPKPNSERFFPN